MQRWPRTTRSRSCSIRRLGSDGEPRDLRDRIARLEREGELVRISADVDLHLEMTEIVDRAG